MNAEPTVDQPLLSEGWRRVNLGSVCVLNPRRPDLRRRDDALTSFIPMAAVREGGKGIARVEEKPFSEVRKGYTYFAEGDVLFAKITPCMQNGKHAIARGIREGIGFGSTEFHVLRSSAAVLPEWIHYFVMQPRVLEDATAFFTGAVGQQRVPEDYLAALQIPLPPISEQRRIAAILTEQMEAVERARAAAEAQIEEGRALPGAYFRGVFNSDASRKWPIRRLREICIADGQYGTSDKATSTPEGLPMLRMGNIADGRIRWDDVKYIKFTNADEKKYRLSEGDLIFNRTNSAELVGKTAVFDGDREAVFASYLRRAACGDLPGPALSDAEGVPRLTSHL